LEREWIETRHQRGSVDVPLKRFCAIAAYSTLAQTPDAVYWTLVQCSALSCALADSDGSITCCRCYVDGQEVANTVALSRPAPRLRPTRRHSRVRRVRPT